MTLGLAVRVVSTRGSAAGGKAIGSSEQEHVVDALAMIGEEGRGSLRKASGSWQTSCDPEVSEWGNPPDEGILRSIHRCRRRTGRTETSQ